MSSEHTTGARNKFSKCTILYCSLIPRIESNKTKDQTHEAQAKTLQKIRKPE